LGGKSTRSSPRLTSVKATESWKRRKRDSVALRIGTHSGRLYGIEVDSDQAEIDVQAMISAINELAEGDKRATENLELAKQVLVQRGAELLDHNQI